MTTRGDEFDPVSFDGASDGEVRFSAIEAADLRLFETGDAVVRTSEFETTSTRITRRDSGTLPTGLNDRLEPTGGRVLEVRFDAVTIAVGGTRERVDPGTEARVSGSW